MLSTRCLELVLWTLSFLLPAAAFFKEKNKTSRWEGDAGGCPRAPALLLANCVSPFSRGRSVAFYLEGWRGAPGGGGGLAAGGGDVPGSIARAPGPGLASRVLARGGVWLRRGPGAPGVALAGEPGWWCWAPPAAPGCVGGVFHRLWRGGSAGTPPALPRGGGGKIGRAHV